MVRGTHRTKAIIIPLGRLFTHALKASRDAPMNFFFFESCNLSTRRAQLACVFNITYRG